MSEIVPETGSARTVAGSGFGGKTVDGCAAISFKPSASVAIGGVPLARPRAVQKTSAPIGFSSTTLKQALMICLSGKFRGGV